MTIVYVLTGLVILLFGRKLFWLFVAALGFALGFAYGPQLAGAGSAPLTGMVAAALAGIVGALLAVFLKGIAITLSGFLGGGLLAAWLVSHWNLGHTQISWLPFVVGGLIGVVLVWLIFNGALILLSSLLGATFILKGLGIAPRAEFPVFVLLALVGILVQAGILRVERRAESR